MKKKILAHKEAFVIMALCRSRSINPFPFPLCSPSYHLLRLSSRRLYGICTMLTQVKLSFHLPLLSKALNHGLQLEWINFLVTTHGYDDAPCIFVHPIRMRDFSHQVSFLQFQIYPTNDRVRVINDDP